MEILTQDFVEQYLRIEANADTNLLNAFELAAIEMVNAELGFNIRAPLIPDYIVADSVKLAIALLITARYDDRVGALDDAMKAMKALCAPHRQARL